MLIAVALTGEHEIASKADKWMPHFCPGCDAPVILKKGAVLAPHFAHKAECGCGYGAGETALHRDIKYALVAHFGRKGARVAEVEKWHHSISRRSDVYVERDHYSLWLNPLVADYWYDASYAEMAGFDEDPIGGGDYGYPLHRERTAYEIQVSGIDEAEVIARTTAYQGIGARVVWVVPVDGEPFTRGWGPAVRDVADEYGDYPSSWARHTFLPPRRINAIERVWRSKERPKNMGLVYVKKDFDGWMFRCDLRPQMLGVWGDPLGCHMTPYLRCRRQGEGAYRALLGREESKCVCWLHVKNSVYIARPWF